MATVVGTGNWVAGMVGYMASNLYGSNVTYLGAFVSPNSTYVGGLTSYVITASIYNFYGLAIAGGFIGLDSGLAYLSTVTYLGSLISGVSYLGGLIGYQTGSISLFSSYVTVSTIAGLAGLIGGLFGFVYGGSTTTISNATFLGGLISSAAIAGAIIGNNSTQFMSLLERLQERKPNMQAG
jgi:hypothetical protein